MTPKQVIEKWVTAFNNADVETLERMYAPNAINHQSPNQPVLGSKAIGQCLPAKWLLPICTAYQCRLSKKVTGLYWNGQTPRDFAAVVSLW
jgi:hypothetical protein